jgi:hypothetical protein
MAAAEEPTHDLPPSRAKEALPVRKSKRQTGRCPRMLRDGVDWCAICDARKCTTCERRKHAKTESEDEEASQGDKRPHERGGWTSDGYPDSDHEPMSIDDTPEFPGKWAAIAEDGRKERLRTGVSQAGVAELCGISSGAFHKLPKLELYMDAQDDTIISLQAELGALKRDQAVAALASLAQ